MGRGGEGERGDNEIGDGEEGPHRGEYEKVDLGECIPVGGDYSKSAHCRSLSHIILYSPSANNPRIITASTAWTTRTGRRSVSDKAMVTLGSVVYTVRFDGCSEYVALNKAVVRVERNKI